MSMKVIIVGPAHPYRGGIAAFNERLAQEYTSQGHTVEIVTFTLQYPGFLFPGTTQYSAEKAPRGLDIVREVNSINPFNWIKVGRKVARKDPDLVIIKFWLPFLAPCLGTVARVIKRRCNTKIISILDNIVPHEKRIGDKCFASYFVGSMDGFISMSASVQSDLEQFNKGLRPSLFSPHPLYDNFGEHISREQGIADLGLDPRGRYMLFFGIIRDYKGLDLLIDALSDERLRALGVKLIVAGEFYNNSEQYTFQARERGVEDMIIWHNEFIADAKVKSYFAAADIVVQTYKSATQSGITQIAYHFERPMLVTNVGGLAEIVPDGKVGYVVDKNPVEIASALVDFYENERHDGFVEGLRDEKKRYHWNEMIAKVDSLLSEI